MLVRLESRFFCIVFIVIIIHGYIVKVAADMEQPNSFVLIWFRYGYSNSNKLSHHLLQHDIFYTRKIQQISIRDFIVIILHERQTHNLSCYPACHIYPYLAICIHTRTPLISLLKLLCSLHQHLPLLVSPFSFPPQSVSWSSSSSGFLLIFPLHVPPRFPLQLKPLPPAYHLLVIVIDSIHICNLSL